jgi:hypothetical protein
MRELVTDWQHLTTDVSAGLPKHHGHHCSELKEMAFVAVSAVRQKERRRSFLHRY